VQFAFNSLGGTKVIFVNGDVTNPTVYIGGTYPSGGTLVVKGNLTIADNTTLGQSGFPVNLVVTGNVVTGSNFNLNGCLYANGKWSRKNVTINGPVTVKGAIMDSSGGVPGSTFVNGSYPFFDPRIVSNNSTLPMYVSNFKGMTP
jgi:predicted acyltransferase (DUF342 family)